MTQGVISLEEMCCGSGIAVRPRAGASAVGPGEDLLIFSVDPLPDFATVKCHRHLLVLPGDDGATTAAALSDVVTYRGRAQTAGRGPVVPSFLVLEGGDGCSPGGRELNDVDVVTVPVVVVGAAHRVFAAHMVEAFGTVVIGHSYPPVVPGVDHLEVGVYVGGSSPVITDLSGNLHMSLVREAGLFCIGVGQVDEFFEPLCRVNHPLTELFVRDLNRLLCSQSLFHFCLYNVDGLHNDAHKAFD